MTNAWGCCSFHFLPGCETLTEWEYLPPVGPRPNKGFVGLKNAGATCYMNSVIQQLYMIPPIRNGILAIEGTGTDVDDDMLGDEKQENEVESEPLFKTDYCISSKYWFGQCSMKYAISEIFDIQKFLDAILMGEKIFCGHWTNLPGMKSSQANNLVCFCFNLFFNP